MFKYTKGWLAWVGLEPIVLLQYIKANLRIRLTHAMIAVFFFFRFQNHIQTKNWRTVQQRIVQQKVNSPGGTGAKVTANSVSYGQAFDVDVASCRKKCCRPFCVAVERESTGNRIVFTVFYTSNSPVTVVTSCLTSANQVQGGFLPDACVGSRDDHSLAIQPCVGSALPMKRVICLRWTQDKMLLYRTV